MKGEYTSVRKRKNIHHFSKTTIDKMNRKPRSWVIWYSCFDEPRTLESIARKWYPESYKSKPLRSEFVKPLEKLGIIEIVNPHSFGWKKLRSLTEWLKPYVNQFLHPKYHTEHWTKGFFYLLENNFRYTFFRLESLLILFNKNRNLLKKYYLIPLKLPSMFGSMGHHGDLNRFHYALRFWDTRIATMGYPELKIYDYLRSITSKTIDVER